MSETGHGFFVSPGKARRTPLAHSANSLPGFPVFALIPQWSREPAARGSP